MAYCHRFDIQVQSSRVYFVACTIGKHQLGKARLRPSDPPSFLSDSQSWWEEGGVASAHCTVLFLTFL